MPCFIKKKKKRYDRTLIYIIYSMIPTGFYVISSEKLLWAAGFICLYPLEKWYVHNIFTNFNLVEAIHLDM